MWPASGSGEVGKGWSVVTGEAGKWGRVWPESQWKARTKPWLNTSLDGVNTPLDGVNTPSDAALKRSE